MLNGEPFTRYNLRALYPFAHQIIVVEGACPGAAEQATADGHSTDGTLELLRRFQSEEDPEGKLSVVTAEDEGHPDGFWPGEKDEMSQAYGRRATGDLLWQVDVDEFYQPRDMARVLERLDRDRSIQAVTLKQRTFWGDLNTWCDGFFVRRGAEIYRRVFRWQPGYTYAAHRPPTVLDEDGRDLHEGKVLCGRRLARQGVLLYHYSLLFPQQAINKTAYYESAAWSRQEEAAAWGRQISQQVADPFRVHNCTQFVSWLNEYQGEHPPEVHAMWEDVLAGRTRAAPRQMDDVQQLMGAPGFRLKRAILRSCAPWDALWYRLRVRWGKFRRRHHATLSHATPGARHAISRSADGSGS